MKISVVIYLFFSFFKFCLINGDQAKPIWTVIIILYKLSEEHV